jgi:hypothetical protein
MPRGDPPCDLVERNAEAFGCCPAVVDDGDDRVMPQRGLSPAGVVEQIGLQAAAHADRGIQGVLAVAVLDAAAQSDLRQVPLAQSLVLERDSPGRTVELERRDGELKQSDVRQELGRYVVGSQSRHKGRRRRRRAPGRTGPQPERDDEEP